MALHALSDHLDCCIHTTVIDAACEIGKTDFETAQDYFDKGLFDEHDALRNALIGSIKKMGKKNRKIELAFFCETHNVF